ncbi:MarR family winged helix-turn-helix transcriptional regulator [Sessilibacter corallicola]|uniref:MarR family transcriptional regulator n=1 Tax=Sessilibacter corallicola TaxID=2904075 RepID=A0ABQ0A9G3_9GAMM|nr:MarR family transcriptional regulator [Sessilibacter corallicola]MCE2030320.1 MarR family transcriptional regulator [Sessilibacter corallicola]
MKNDDYLENLLGAFATAVSSSVDAQVNELGGRSLNHEAALVTVYNHPDEGIDTLSKVLNLSHSGAVRLVDTLEKEALLERKQSPKDARAVILRVTKKGKDRAVAVLSARSGVLADAVALLNAEQKSHVTPIIEALLSSMTDNRMNARRICRMCDEGVCRPLGCPVENSIPE